MLLKLQNSPKSPIGFVERQILIWLVWDGAWDAEFLTSSLVILRLPIQDHTLINNGQKLRLLKAIHPQMKEDREKPPINRLSYRLFRKKVFHGNGSKGKVTWGFLVRPRRRMKRGG